MKYTEGPWVIDEHENHVRAVPNGDGTHFISGDIQIKCRDIKIAELTMRENCGAINKFYVNNYNHLRANAKLIASAPRLYALLRSIVANLIIQDSDLTEISGELKACLDQSMAELDELNKWV